MCVFCISVGVRTEDMSESCPGNVTASSNDSIGKGTLQFQTTFGTAPTHNCELYVLIHLLFLVEKTVFQENQNSSYFPPLVI